MNDESNSITPNAIEQLFHQIACTINKSTFGEEFSTSQIEWPRHPDRLYHLTDSGGLLGLVESKSFWLSHASCMNDESETKIARRLLRKYGETFVDQNQGESLTAKVCEEFAKELSKDSESQTDAYLTSFCGKRPDASMWDRYGGKGEGICVVVAPDRLEVYPTPRDSQTGLVKVYYVDSELPDEFRQLIQRFLSGSVAMCAFLDELAQVAEDQDHDTNNLLGKAAKGMGWMLACRIKKISCCLKAATFQGEDEWRLVRFGVDPGEVEQILNSGLCRNIEEAGRTRKLIDCEESKVRYRVGRYGITPYRAFDFAPEAITEIILGRRHPQAGCTAPIRNMLSRYGFGHVKISTDDTPIR